MKPRKKKNSCWQKDCYLPALASFEITIKEKIYLGSVLTRSGKYCYRHFSIMFQKNVKNTRNFMKEKRWKF